MACNRLGIAAAEVRRSLQPQLLQERLARYGRRPKQKLHGTGKRCAAWLARAPARKPQSHKVGKAEVSFVLMGIVATGRQLSSCSQASQVASPKSPLLSPHPAGQSITSKPACASTRACIAAMRRDLFISSVNGWMYTTWRAVSQCLQSGG